MEKTESTNLTNGNHNCPLGEMKQSCFYQIFEEYENELRDLELSALTLIFNKMLNALIRKEYFDTSTLKDLKFIINEYLDDQPDQYDLSDVFGNEIEPDIN